MNVGRHIPIHEPASAQGEAHRHRHLVKNRLRAEAGRRGKLLEARAFALGGISPPSALRQGHDAGAEQLTGAILQIVSCTSASKYTAVGSRVWGGGNAGSRSTSPASDAYRHTRDGK